MIGLGAAQTGGPGEQPEQPAHMLTYLDMCTHESNLLLSGLVG